MPDGPDAAVTGERAHLGERLTDVVGAAPHPLGVAVRADDGWAWDHASAEVVPAASTIKVPVLVAVLALVQEGRLRLSDPVTLPSPDARVGGAGALSLLPSVATVSVREALTLMVAISDNDAANALIDLGGLLPEPVGTAGSTPGALAALLARVPTAHTVLQRRLMDQDARARGLDNETCAADLADLMVALRSGRLLDPGATWAALDLLRKQQSRTGLPAYLPEDVLVASKPGDLPGVRTEVALLERAGRWAAVAVTADHLEDGGVDRGTSLLPTFAALGSLAGALL